MPTFHGIPIETLHARMDDPAVKDWLVRQLTSRRPAAPRPDDALRAIFTPERLARFLETSTPAMASALLPTLPTDLFAGLKGALMNLALIGGGQTALHVPPLLVANDVTEGLGHLEDLLRAFTDQADDEADEDDEDFAEGLLTALQKLAPDHGRPLAERLLAEALVLDPLQRARLAIAYDLDVVNHLAEAFTFERLAPPVASPDAEPASVLAEALLGSERFTHYIHTPVDRRPASLHAVGLLFHADAPLTELDRLFAAIDDTDLPIVIDLLREAHTHSGHASCTTLLAVIERIDLDALDADQSSALLALALASVAEAWLLPAPSALTCPLAHLLDGMTAPLQPSPWRDVGAERLNLAPPHEVAALLADRMENATSFPEVFAVMDLLRAVSPAIAVATTLRWAHLPDAPSTPDPSVDPVAAALARWSELDTSQRFLLRDTLSEAPADLLVPFLVHNFEADRHDAPDLDLWCELAQTAPDPRLLPLLESQLHRHITAVGVAFDAVAALVAPDHPRRDEVREAAERALAPPSGPPSIELLLRCPACTDVNPYTFTHLTVEVALTGWKTHLPTSLACTSCGARGALAITPYADNVLEEELYRASTHYGTDDEGDSPLNIVMAQDEPSSPARPVQTVRSAPKISRNAPCPCGSGKKYKKCCGG